MTFVKKIDVKKRRSLNYFVIEMNSSVAKKRRLVTKITGRRCAWKTTLALEFKKPISYGQAQGLFQMM